ncbi:MAG TPA: gamma-glutamyltransferase, partial [Gaiellaceae bacterium]
EIDRFSRENGGLLDAGDMRDWRATLEQPVTLDYRGLTVCKTEPWGQGPVGLQQLALLSGFDVGELSEEELVHVVTECAKLSFADRDAAYGDALPVPLDTLLSTGYNDERRKLVTDEASDELRPGLGRLPSLHTPSDTLSLGVGEPTRGDTVHLDVADRFGNLFSATPSGGWLQSSPVIPALGWPLGTRAQMFWLEDGLASSLKPRTRPRTTLSPGLVLRGGEPWLAYGTPGGDQQEQWALHVFLHHVDRGLNLQEAVDAPDFHTQHLIDSFYPRGFAPRSLFIEDRAGDDVVRGLRARGHDVTVAPPWSLGRVCAVKREDGQLVAAANPRGMQGYAVAR